MPYLYSVVMHEYRHVLQRQSLANQDREKNLRSQGFKSGNEVEAYAWELDHTDETGVKQEPGSVASIWKQLNDEYQLLEDTERKRMLSTAKAAYAKAQALVKGTGVTLEPFKP